MPIPDELAATAAEYREKLLDAVVETDEALMERYLGGEELDPAAVAAALKTAVTNDELYPVSCGVATKNLGTHALLDLLVEGVPSPARKPSPIQTDAAIAAFVFKTVADAFAGRISVFRAASSCSALISQSSASGEFPATSNSTPRRRIGATVSTENFFSPPP